MPSALGGPVAHLIQLQDTGDILGLLTTLAVAIAIVTPLATPPPLTLQSLLRNRRFCGALALALIGACATAHYRLQRTEPRAATRDSPVLLRVNEPSMAESHCPERPGGDLDPETVRTCR